MNIHIIFFIDKFSLGIKLDTKTLRFIHPGEVLTDHKKVVVEFLKTST